jgi:lipopolysaccharide export system protein LptA
LYCRDSSNNLPPRGGPGLIGRICLALVLCLELTMTAHALPEDAQQPIHIRADKAEIDNNAGRVVYSGSVQVDQGTMRVTAEKMIVEYENQKVVRIVATGTPAHYEQQIEADQAQVKANADTITYHTQAERVDLEGSAYLEQEGNTITGDFIRYDIVAGRVDASAQGDQRIRMVLQPASNPQ